MANKPQPTSDKAMTPQEVKFALTLAWILAPSLCAVWGYYIGTIFVSEHKIDLQIKDLTNAIPYGIGGFFVGILLAAAASIFWPRLRAKDIEDHLDS